MLDKTNVVLTIITRSYDGKESDTVTNRYQALHRVKDGAHYVLYDDRVLRFDGKTLRDTGMNGGGQKLFEAGKTHTATIPSAMGTLTFDAQTLSMSGTLETGLEIVFKLMQGGQTLVTNTLNVKIEEK